jgi:hypothetical protein
MFGNACAARLPLGSAPGTTAEQDAVVRALFWIGTRFS